MSFVFDSMSNSIKLIDFGHARILIEDFNSILEDDDGCGTKGYIAPETKYEGIISFKSDIYSSGIFLLYMLVPHLLSFLFSCPSSTINKKKDYNKGNDINLIIIQHLDCWKKCIKSS